MANNDNIFIFPAGPGHILP